MSDPLKKVKTGDRFAPSARRENLITDTITAFQAQRRNQSAGADAGGVRTAIVQLGAALGGLGFYAGTPVIWRQEINPATDAALTALINTTLTTAQPTIVLVNTREIDSELDEPALSTEDKPILFIAIRTPLMSSEDPPRSVWLIDGRQPLRCTSA